VKASVGAVSADVAKVTEERIGQARVAMGRIDEIMEGDPAARPARLEAFRHEVDRLNESTVCEKSELEWPRQAKSHHVANAAKLWLTENTAMLLGQRKFRPVEPLPPLTPLAPPKAEPRHAGSGTGL
jgi:hypothetical protein